MQRSQKALLQRRAFQKAISGSGIFYKLSLSLACVMWGFLFLLSLWISRGDGYRDESGTHRPGTSTSDDKLKLDERSSFVNKVSSVDESVVYSDVNTCYDDAEATGPGDKLLATAENPSHKTSVETHEANFGSSMSVKTDSLKTERQVFSVPLGLDDFKSRAFSSKSKDGVRQGGGIVHRLEPGGQEYNYASSSKGAKVLAFNKEAKGASNILSRDKDKYLRNPCSVEDKFVVIELSEETLVYTIEIANFEHHSSNLKEFEVLGSLVYPTNAWVSLGNFTAANVKLTQRFTLPEPKWVRYLKVNLISHHGSEFYCTLSVVEVYGVDAVERMLEDLISVPDSKVLPSGGNGEQKSLSSVPESTTDDEIYHTQFKDMDSKASAEKSSPKFEGPKAEVPDPVEEIRYQQVGRAPGDSVLKVLLQKVRNLDLSLSVLERYLEEASMSYGNLFKEFEEDSAEKDIILQRIKSDVKKLYEKQAIIAKDIDDLLSWKSLVSSQLAELLEDNLILRSKIDSVQENQRWMENKGIAIFVVTIAFGVVALMRLLLEMVSSVYVLFKTTATTQNAGKFCHDTYSWLLLVVCCCSFLLILSL